AQAPDLTQALDRVRAEGWAYVILSNSSSRIRDNGDSPSDGASQNSSSRWPSVTDRWYRPRPVGTAALTRALSPSGDRAAAVEHEFGVGEQDLELFGLGVGEQPRADQPDTHLVQGQRAYRHRRGGRGRPVRSGRRV